MKAPNTLTVVLVDTFRAETALVHLNDSLPFQRRTVQIELTHEQRAAIAPRHLGQSNGHDRYEEYGDVWMEPTTGSVTEKQRT